MNMFSAMVHNESIARDVENKLNALIRTVTENGGCLYLCDKSNKDMSVKLTEPVSLAYFVMCNVE